MHKYRFLTLFLCFTLLAGILKPQNLNAAGKEIVITGDVVHIRAGPGENYQAIGEATKGETYTLINEEGEWYRISLEDDGEGWVANWLASTAGDSSSSLEETADTPGESAEADEDEEDSQEEHSEKSEPEHKQKGIVLADQLIVRSGPGTEYKAIGSLKKNSEVACLTVQDGWVQISFQNQPAWINSEYISLTGSIPKINEQQKRSDEKKAVQDEPLQEKKTEKTVTDKYNGVITATALKVRDSGSLRGNVIGTVTEGEVFAILEEQNDWLKIEYEPGRYGWVAGWFVYRHPPQVKKRQNDSSLQNKLIIIDPGHGGKDDGATGFDGTKEKDLNLETGRILYDKLHAAGANVILTRNSDEFVSLNARVKLSHILEADAFISIHFDSTTSRQVHGITSYYYHPYQKSLASAVHDALREQIEIHDRGVRFGDYHVIRENKQNAVLLELGYLSNPQEETRISSQKYQEQAADAIIQGLTNFFNR